MDTATGSIAPLARSFDDFEPYCSWQRDEANDTLIIHLTEFKKNQLKVQINNQGILTISGERPVTDTKWNRFSKQIKLSKNCNTGDISAKFVGGLLYVTMPKKTAILDQPNTSHADQQPLKENEKPKLETLKDNLGVKSSIDNLGSKVTNNKDASYKFLKETLGRRSRMEKKVVVSFIVVAAMVALGAYLTIKYQSKNVAN